MGPGFRRDDANSELTCHDLNNRVYCVSWRRLARSARKVALPRSSSRAASARVTVAATSCSSCASTRWLSVWPSGTSRLPADIQFESQVTGKRSPWQVKSQGDTAWVIATTEYDGTFEGSPVNFVSAQLAVLSRESGAWQIRSIHWSSRRR